MKVVVVVVDTVDFDTVGADVVTEAAAADIITYLTDA